MDDGRFGRSDRDAKLLAKRFHLLLRVRLELKKKVQRLFRRFGEELFARVEAAARGWNEIVSELSEPACC
jgi:hypothetical protein